jgi:hypothetical protein
MYHNATAVRFALSCSNSAGGLGVAKQAVAKIKNKVLSINH